MGYIYEDLSTLYLIAVLGDKNCEQLPTVMYYIKNAEKVNNNKINNLIPFLNGINQIKKDIMKLIYV